jgi:hypothetical protein
MCWGLIPDRARPLWRGQECLPRPGMGYSQICWGAVFDLDRRFSLDRNPSNKGRRGAPRPRKTSRSGSWRLLTRTTKHRAWALTCEALGCCQSLFPLRRSKRCFGDCPAHGAETIPKQRTAMRGRQIIAPTDDAGMGTASWRTSPGSVYHSLGRGSSYTLV